MRAVFFVSALSSVSSARIFSLVDRHRADSHIEGLQGNDSEVIPVSLGEAGEDLSSEAHCYQISPVRRLGMLFHALTYPASAWQVFGFGLQLPARGQGCRERCPPVRCVRNELGALADAVSLPSGVRVGTIEPQEISEYVTLILRTFYDGYLDVESQARSLGVFSEEEMEQLLPSLQKADTVLNLWNRVFLSNWARWRLGERLNSGGTRRTEAKNSVLLAAYDEESSRIVGSIELLIEPRDGQKPDAHILPPLPWETRFPDCAYMGNLCVAESHRGRGLGKALLRITEGIAREWGFSHLYLHASTTNEKLLSMYSRWQYEQLPDFDQPGVDARYHRCSLLAAGRYPNSCASADFADVPPDFTGEWTLRNGASETGDVSETVDSEAFEAVGTYGPES